VLAPLDHPVQSYRWALILLVITRLTLCQHFSTNMTASIVPAATNAISEMETKPDWQDTSKSETKPPYRFWDRPAGLIMTGCGWIAERWL